MTNKLIAW